MRLLAYVLLLLAFPATAQVTQHELVRRLSVFPLKVPADFQAKAEEIWWDLRDTLTKDKRFLVATKNYMMQQNVFQAREALEPNGAIILGQVLDGDAVVTTWLDNRTLHMAVYEAKYGRPLWKQEVPLQPSLPIMDQLSPATLKLARDFVASIPYQGFVVLDPLKTGVIFREGRRMLFKADIGLGAEVEPGDTIEIVRVASDHIKPLFTHGAQVEVIGEGRIVSLDRETVVAELVRVSRANDIKEKALVRLPKEMKRLKQLYALSDSLKGRINAEYLSPDLSPAQQAQAENKPLVSSLAFIVNLAAFLFLAF